MSNETAIVSLKEKIDDLNQQAWDVRVTDLPKAFELSQESVKLARSINYSKGLAEGLRSLGFAYVRFFKNDEAAPLLKESLSFFQSLNDLKGQAVVYEYLGIIERNWGNLGASLELLLKANDLVLQTGPPEVQTTICYQIGVTYKHLGNAENALDYLYRSLSLAKKMKFTLIEAYAINIIGSIYFDNGNYNQALDCYQQSLIIRQQSHDKWGEAGSLDNIGFTYLKLNDLDKAIEYCKQSLEICQGTGDKKGEANALLHLAEIYQQAGDVKQASIFSNESLEIRKARGDKRGEAEVLLFLAGLYKNRKDVDDHKIFEWLSGALKIADEIKAQDLLSKTYYNLHEYYQQKRNFKESLVQLQAHFLIEKELHKNSINQKIVNLEISHKAEIVSQRNKELTELNEKIEKANEELKIEAALEKIRSRTNAMHRSESLHEVINEVNDQLHQLGFPFDSTDFLTDYSDKGYNLWVANFPTPIYVPAIDHKIFHLLKEAIKRGDTFFTFILTSEEKNIHFKNVFENTIAKNSSEELKQYVYSAKGMATSCVVLKNIILSVTNFASVPYSDRENEILKRFAFVFEQSYTRFLDLQKAEAQAREAKIEAVLEKVRSRSLAMHKSDELSEVILVVFEKLKELNVITDGVALINLYTEGTKDVAQWIANPELMTTGQFTLPYFNHPILNIIWEARESGKDFVTHTFSFEEKNSFWNHAFQHSDYKFLSDELKNMLLESEGYGYIVAFEKYSSILICTYTKQPFSTSAIEIVKRFARVFEQAYIRFLDLQKAEAQAREAHIEIALEKVRSRTMAMQKSDELADVATLLFRQVNDLGIKTWTTGFNIWSDDNNAYEDWIASPAGGFIEPYVIDATAFSEFKVLSDAKKSGTEFFILYQEGEILKETYRQLSRFATKNQFEKVLEEGFQFPLKQYVHMVFGSKVSLMFITYDPVPEAHDIFKRFGKVFEQTYTRFLDLQKAEAQAREATIEAALERVRSRTMAMHKSHELAETAQLLYNEFGKLGINTFTCGYMFVDETKNTQTAWVVLPDGTLLPNFIVFPLTGDHVLDIRYKDWKEKKTLHVLEIQGEANKEHHRFLSKHVPAFVVQDIFSKVPDRIIFNCANFSYGYLLILATDFFSQEEKLTITRFAKVFDLTYRRFLDLQKAEAQAREAQIEASLERIRAKAMAMHRSEEIDEVLEVLFDQFDVLGIVPMSTHLTLINLETNSFTFRETGKGGRKSFGEQTVPIDSMDIWKDAADRWRNMEPLSLNKLHFPKESLPMVWQVFHESFASMPEGHKITPEDYPEGIYHTAGNCKFGYIGMNQVRPATEEEEQIVLKFAVEFGRLYQRYLDLQKAEAQTKEARIEAALERVRSRTMGMQKSEELKDVIQVIYEQFVLLNINIEHTGFVMDYKARDDYDIWIADQLGVPSHVTIPYFDSVYYNRFNEAKEKGEDFFAANLDFEEKNKFYKKIIEYVPGLPEETKEFLFNIPGLAISTVLLENVCLYIENFSGIPYTDEENKTLMRFGKVFQQTYTRFKDLKLAEAHALQAEEDLIKLQTEKKRAEDALSELQVTQKQLIQSEKMASLGELTAGIAHEIQNPLNFVNNFSDVNKELLVEMKEEMEKGNTEEVIAIANNIISNEEKINHHGKRADAIVKGMLQHSRSSSGVKEPTDINELADEYLRLAYHGLRAKDKSFNATMKTDFDETVGKINIVPQDIGRAVLNLITNAFYAVTEKKKIQPENYDPIVTVATKKKSGKVFISVKDNGKGIPQKALDKIFQPFFTTKPTGQGTGLGLSLSYDIVKAHNGEIKVKTKEGEGSEFVIQLPIDQ